MKDIILCLQLVLLLSPCSQSMAGEPRKGRPKIIGMKISSTFDYLLVTWKRPRIEVNTTCNESNVQYRSHGYPERQSVEVRGLSFTLPTPDSRRNYMFKVRMKYDCHGNWSAWTPERSLTPLGKTVIDPNRIGMKISNTSDSILVIWERPNIDVNEVCYLTNVQYKSYCDVDWQSVEKGGLSFTLSSPDSTRNYIFRVRVKFNCLLGDWSAWTPEAYWRNQTETGRCIMEDSEVTFDIRNYILIIILPLTFFLLACMLTHKRVRRCIVPPIPDPKHTQESILNMDQSQWRDSLSPCREDECETVEIVCLKESEEEESEEEESEEKESEEEQSEVTADGGLSEITTDTHHADTFRQQAYLDLHDNSMHCVYDGSEEATQLRGAPYTVHGYTVI